MSNEAHSREACDQITEIHFIKTHPGEISAAQPEKSMSVFTMPSSPLQSLYLTIHNVYAPMLIGYGCVDLTKKKMFCV